MSPVLTRDKELKELASKINPILSEGWTVVANPRGLGKSWLAAAFASTWPGPALFTDLQTVTPCRSGVESALAETIDPFLPVITRIFVRCLSATR